MTFRTLLACAAITATLADPVSAQQAPSAYAVTSPNGIDEEDFVQIGGIKQWVTIRGADRANPVLLIVGGTQVDGPGAILSPYVRTFQPWEKDFTVVQWDPRGAGKTFVANGGTIGPDLTIDRLVQDGLELSDDLRARLGKARIVLLGVNFGSTLAVKMVQAKPELFSAYVAAGQITKPRAEREQFGYERLLRLATAAKDEASLADLKLAGPDVWRQPRDPARVAAFQRVFVKYRPPVPANPMQEALSAPHWTMDELMAAQGAAARNEQVLGKAWGEGFDYASLGSNLKVPVFVIQGEEATSSPAPMAKAWLDGLTAPKKVFVTIPGAGNHALETHTAAYLDLLDQYVRPVALAADRKR
ncbi:alpha/beta hydrolase [Caulobacter sp. 1776]|uniref:alpha/beta fold hydrolase n=1 Tax=Caulobacter sp. 1776 TaxID=3156420 RepID=UPI0033995AA5